MNSFEKIKLFFTKKVDDIVPISETDKIKEIIKEKTKDLKKLSESYYESEGKKKTLENKIKGCNKTLKDISAAGNMCKKNNDEVNLKKLFVEKKNIENEIEMTQKTLELTKKLSEDLYVRKTKMETYISSLKHKLDQLKIKEEYTEQANKFISVMNDVDKEDSFNENEEIIDVNFNAAELKIEDFDSSISVDDVINKYTVDDEFEKFKQSL